jgi:phospholipid N-methyltransferase
MTNGHRAAFLREFVRAPLTVAAVAHSGETLADLITAPVPSSGDPLVVELGPGTGAFTVAIQRRLTGRGHHLAIEVNERFAGHRLADVIVSGLPWAAFAPDQQDELLNAVTGALTPDGAFTTFAYSFARWTPAARRLRRSLHEQFEEVVTGRTVWANVPPAWVYFCRRPRIPARPHILLAA